MTSVLRVAVLVGIAAAASSAQFAAAGDAQSAAAGDAQPLPAYELTLVHVADGPKVDYVFAIGHAGFRTVEGLKRFLGPLPRGTRLTWRPGCDRFGDEPLLSSEEEMRAFRRFLEERGRDFVLVPSG